MEKNVAAYADCAAWFRRTYFTLKNVEAQVRRWAPSSHGNPDETLTCVLMWQEQLWRYWDHLSLEHSRRSPVVLMAILDILTETSGDAGIKTAADAAIRALSEQPCDCPVVAYHSVFPAPDSVAERQ